MLIASIIHMKPLKPTHTLVKRLAPAVAVWAIGKAIDSPQVKSRLARIDDNVNRRRTRVLRNARSNRGWLAAGAFTVIAGLGMMARAAKR
jgi:hypothetical protein